MKMSRKAKRYDDTVLPGDFQDFEAFKEGDALVDGCLQGSLRRQGAKVELSHLVFEFHPSKKQNFLKLRAKAERLIHQVDYLDERLQIVDHDRRGLYIQIRSLPPYKDDTQIQFNEISLTKDKVGIKRIAFNRKDERKREVSLDLSEEVFRRLLEDVRRVFSEA